jgi:hypothetical protein
MENECPEDKTSMNCVAIGNTPQLPRCNKGVRTKVGRSLSGVRGDRMNTRDFRTDKGLQNLSPMNRLDR